MSRQRILSFVIFTAALLFIAMLNFNDRPTSFATAAAVDSGADQDTAGQIKELQKQVAELQGRMGDPKAPHIVAAGTATIHLGARQDNKTSLRVKLPANLAAHIGSNCIVQLTNRYPTGGSFFVAYWKPTTDGFDILLADPSLDGIGINPNRTEPYYIDWIVVQK